MIQNDRGFTLVEMMMAMAISCVVAAALFMAMRTGNEQLETSDMKMTIQDSAREGLYKMIQEIRESSPTRITIGASDITFSVPDPNSPVDGTTYAPNWPGHTIRYAISGTQVIRTNSTTGDTSVIANDVTALSFTGNAAQPTVVTVALSVQRTLKNQHLLPATALQITGQARIRNTG